MYLDKDRLFDDLVNIAKSWQSNFHNTKEIGSYLTSTCKSVWNKKSIITHIEKGWDEEDKEKQFYVYDSNGFYYYFDKTKKIFYLVETINDMFMGAHQMLLDFKNDEYHWDLFFIFSKDKTSDYLDVGDITNLTDENTDFKSHNSKDVFKILNYWSEPGWYENREDFVEKILNKKDTYYIESQVEKVTKDFIYKINDSKKLKIEMYNYNNIDEYFNDDSNDSYENHESINIISIDTKETIISFEKAIINDEKVCKFIVNVTNMDGDNFSVNAILKTKEQLNQLVVNTANALKQYPEFSKYAEDLESCI